MKEEKEQIIAKFSLDNLFDFIPLIVTLGYRTTGNKFSVLFHGSKGYLDSLEIICEGVQNETNTITLSDYMTVKRRFKKKILNIFHSNMMGVRLSIGKDEPKTHCVPF